MDPNATLRDIRELVEKITDDPEGFAATEAVELAELFDGLDSWLSRGGFPPKDWSMRTRRG